MVSNKWGFTKLTRLEYLKRKTEGTLKGDGSDVKIVRTKGPLAESPVFAETSKK
jgi:large subunit ribosomal protein L10e